MCWDQTRWGNRGGVGDAVGSWWDGELCVSVVPGGDNSSPLSETERGGIEQSTLLEIKDIQVLAGAILLF